MTIRLCCNYNSKCFTSLAEDKKCFCSNLNEIKRRMYEVRANQKAPTKLKKRSQRNVEYRTFLYDNQIPFLNVTGMYMTV